jgi:hypothetical protein
VLDEFYRVAFRKKIYRSIDELQADLDRWMSEYNDVRPHQGRWCYGKTPMRTLLDAIPLEGEIAVAGIRPDTHFVGHPPRRGAICQIMYTLLQISRAK